LFDAMTLIKRPDELSTCARLPAPLDIPRGDSVIRRVRLEGAADMEMEKR
jgi:hypothetical protein